VTGEARVCTPVVARLVVWLDLVHLCRVAHARICHHKLLHGSTNLGEVDATVVVAIESVVEPLSLIRRHLVVESCKKARDLLIADPSVSDDHSPDTLELHLTLGSPDWLEVHVGSHLTAEDGVSTREAACRRDGARAWATHWRDRTTHGRAWATHWRDRTTHGRMWATHGRMWATHGRMWATHGRMWATHGRMWAAHRRVWATHGRMRTAHGRMRAAHGRTRTAHRRMRTAVRTHVMHFQ